MLCAPRVRKPAPGVCWRPPMGGTISWAWPHWRWPRKGFLPARRRLPSSRPCEPRRCCRRIPPLTTEPKISNDRQERSRIEYQASIHPSTNTLFWSIRYHVPSVVHTAVIRLDISCCCAAHTAWSLRDNARTAARDRGDYPRLSDAKPRRVDRGAAGGGSQGEHRRRRQGGAGASRPSARDLR